MIAPQTVLQNRYLILNQIGQGGMGAVYIATDQRFGSTVALKETFFTDPALRRAFEREARLLNRLRHPALPRVSDHFTEEEGQFLVMEFITGEDLWEMLKAQGGAFPVKEVLGWADQLLDALDYLHTQEPSVIHRDIKPQNLKLTTRGQIILLDFGLAKGTPQQASQVNATGSIFGYSRNYAPLEQIQGTGTDTRSDLYSLAATVYHLLTGTTPPDALTRAAAVLNGQPDPLRPANELHSQVPYAVAQLLTRAMSQNAGLRPQTAAAMRDALSEAIKQTVVTGQETSAGGATPTSPLLEQDTQLLDGEGSPKITGADGYPATMASVSDHKYATTADSGLQTDAGQDPATRLDEAESVVTKLHAPAQVAQTKRAMPARALGIAAGVVILVLLAAVVYALSRRSEPATSGEQLPAPASSPSAAPSPVNQSAENPDVNTNDSQTTEPAGSSRPVPSPAKNAQRSDVPPAPTPPPVPTQPNTAPPNQANANTANSDDPATWDEARIAEEKKKAMRMKRRARQERMRAEEEMRRAQEMNRRRRPY
jgi:serine/threonine protein kinase